MRCSNCNYISCLAGWCLAVAFVVMGGQSAVAGDAEQEAFLAAVEKAAPCVVRIETIGGDERVGKAFTIPETTGLILTADGWIITSSLGVAHQPDAIFVLLADGSRHTARLIMTDRNRKLALLKIDLPEDAAPLPVPVVAPQSTFRPGQWTLTLGRVLDVDEVSVTVGVLSAVNRIWGKAIQTDAAVSANNYGGPLLDVEGRVMGVLTPFGMDMGGGGQKLPVPSMPGGDGSPDGEKKEKPNLPIPIPGATPGAPKALTPAEEAMQGVDLYDSGVGFAIPLEDVYRLLPRMQKNELKPASPMGVVFDDQTPVFADPIIRNVMPGTPADKAGLEPEDRILSMNGVQTLRVADVRHQLIPLYAGDEIKMVVRRKDEQKDITLVLESEQVSK